ncbi:MAG: alpha-N-acetylglucosaminidase C-terminal domain-containing protein [Merdibacter sp.]
MSFSKSTFEMNAKSLITTWGSSGGSLVDYGFRIYEGMFLI